jgi:hypothetical protein
VDFIIDILGFYLLSGAHCLELLSISQEEVQVNELVQEHLLLLPCCVQLLAFLQKRLEFFLDLLIIFHEISNGKNILSNTWAWLCPPWARASPVSTIDLKLSSLASISDLIASCWAKNTRVKIIPSQKIVDRILPFRDW